MLSSPAVSGDLWSKKILYNFCSQADCVDGSQPFVPTMLRAGKTFYGTTNVGGEHNGGTIFRFCP